MVQIHRKYSETNCRKRSRRRPTIYFQLHAYFSYFGQKKGTLYTNTSIQCWPIHRSKAYRKCELALIDGFSGRGCANINGKVKLWCTNGESMANAHFQWISGENWEARAPTPPYNNLKISFMFTECLCQSSIASLSMNICSRRVLWLPRRTSTSQNTRNWMFPTCMLSKQCNRCSRKVWCARSSPGDTTTGECDASAIPSAARPIRGKNIGNFSHLAPCVSCPPNRYLENEGIEYLRTYLHLPSEIVPSTLKRAARTETARARPSAAPRTGDSKAGNDRQQYRRAPLEGADKKADVGAGAADVEFVSVRTCAQHSLRIGWTGGSNLLLSFYSKTARWIRTWLKTTIN